MRRPHPLRSILPWAWDGLALAYLMTGGYHFDSRLALLPSLSLNQLLGMFLGARLLWCIARDPHRAVVARVTLASVVLLTVLLAVRAVQSPNIGYARLKVFGYFLLVLPVLVHVDVHVRSAADVRRFLIVGTGAAAAMVLLSLPSMLTMREGQRLSILAGGPNVFARLVGAGLLCACIVLRIGPIGRAWRRLALAWMPAAAVALLLAGSKAVLLALLVAVGVWAWLQGRQRRVALLTLVLTIAVLLPWGIHPLVQDQDKNGGIVRMLRRPDFDDPLGSFGARKRFVSATWNQIQDHPLFGVGTGAWGIDHGLGLGEAYPHNLFLEIQAELGAVALGLLLLCMWRFPRLLPASSSEQRALAIGLWGLAAYWLTNVMLSGDLIDSRYLWLWLVVLEIQLRATRDKAVAA